MERKTMIHAGGALLLALGGFAASPALAGGASLPVASDGTLVLPLERAPAVVEGSRGTLQPGQRRDALAEFPARIDTPEEYRRFSETYKALIPAYASKSGQPEAAPESVIGSDRRFRLYAKESGYPYRAIGLLTFNQAGGSYSCTGWLVGKDTVATAGHCVHQGGGGVWSTNMVFYPARNSSSSPYGSCTAKRLYSVSGWTTSGNSEFDYGAVKLNCTIGNTTGWLGRVHTTSSQVGLSVLIAGYPGDKTAGTQWGGGGDIYVSEPRKTRYMIDTAGGQSGAPVLEADRGGSCAGACGVAIHAYGASGGYNSATRITSAVSTNLGNWVAAP